MPRKKAAVTKAAASKTSASRTEARKWVGSGRADVAPKQTRRRLFQVIAGLIVAAAVPAALIFLGKWGQEQIRDQERYLARFSDIVCVPPPGLSRGAFLDEVQYLSRLPDRLSVLDDGLSQTLSAAFAKHPWVEKVDSVVVEPPRRINVGLVLRRPALAVRTTEGLIAVDRHGVRLPKNALTGGLPILEGTAPPPQGPAGTKWGDANVERRAAQASLPLQDKKLGGTP